jgi:hypothetical protein
VAAEKEKHKKKEKGKMTLVEYIKRRFTYERCKYERNKHKLFGQR